MPDPDFEIRGGGRGRGSSWEGGQSPKKISSSLWASVWSKNKGGGASCGSTTARGSLIAVGSLRVGVATGRALK